MNDNGDGWISVKDEMPEPSVHVLVWLEDMKDTDRPEIAAWWPPTGRNAGGWWDDSGDYLITSKITHWRRWPSKPKGLE